MIDEGYVNHTLTVEGERVKVRLARDAGTGVWFVTSIDYPWLNCGGMSMDIAIKAATRELGRAIKNERIR